ncbi:hypothetical protein AB0F67_33560 [Nonomuraea dietziae]
MSRRDAASEGSAFRYLGLPGRDLLDVRYLHDRLCVPEQTPLQFLGFDESAKPESKHQTSFNVSLDEVMRLPRVLRDSEVRPENIRILANSNSSAWQSAVKRGPYDLINLDLCTEFITDSPTMDLSLYNAIKKLFALQQRRLAPWSLLLTARVGTSGVDPDAWELLAANLNATAVKCAELNPAATEAFGIALEDTTEMTDWDGQRIFQVSTLALCLWVAQQAIDINCEVKVASSYAYKIGNLAEYCNIVSIAFRFKPIVGATPDKIGLANVATSLLDICATTQPLPQRIAETCDVDELLIDNAELRNQLIDETAELLRHARYDPDSYRKWVTMDSGLEAEIPVGS